MNKTRNQVI